MRFLNLNMQLNARMMITELSEMEFSWREAQAIAKDKTRWKSDSVAAPFPTGGDKD